MVSAVEEATAQAGKVTVVVVVAAMALVQRVAEVEAKGTAADMTVAVDLVQVVWVKVEAEAVVTVRAQSEAQAAPPTEVAFACLTTVHSAAIVVEEGRMADVRGRAMVERQAAALADTVPVVTRDHLLH